MISHTLRRTDNLDLDFKGKEIACVVFRPAHKVEISLSIYLTEAKFFVGQRAKIKAADSYYEAVVSHDIEDIKNFFGWSKEAKNLYKLCGWITSEHVP